MSIDYIEITNCIACGSTNLNSLISLNSDAMSGVQPLANALVSSQSGIYLYPLKANICMDCTHIQLSHAVHPSKLFENYLYVSGTSKTLREYFEAFVAMVTSKYNAFDKSDITILDIGCNDGTLLDVFVEAGYTKTYGIDPSDVVKTNSNHTIYNDYFETSMLVTDRKYDIIIAQNVFAHSCNNHYDAINFLRKCSSILSDNGSIYIQLSQTDMIQNAEFDTIYHEHLSFYNEYSFNTLIELSNIETPYKQLYITECLKAHIHGVSTVYKLEFTPKDYNKPDRVSDQQLQRDITKYINNINDKMEAIRMALYYHKKCGFKIIGLGAPAKATVTINHYGIGYLIDYIIDENSLKHEKFIPCRRKVPIHGIDFLKHEDNTKILLIPFAWNFLKEMLNKTKPILKDKDIVLYLDLNDKEVHDAYSH